MTDTLDKLKKAFEQTISTSASVQPWNEPLTRRDMVQSSQALAGPIVPGGLGSWVASGGFPLTVTTSLGVQTGAATPNRNRFEMGLGLPGVPDVDFIPYAANTNRFGAKGPSLLGHPISWEVVGPTLKSPYCDWQWNVIPADNEIVLEAGPFPRLGAVPTVEEAYGLAGDVPTNYDPFGGLYVLFSFTGEDFTGSLAGGRTPITATYKARAPYEIFRVTDFAGQKFFLRSEKLIGDYYGSGNGCRAITVIRPKVTRLVPFQVPVSGQTQRNRVFVFVPPETSATSEYMPPFDQGTLGLGTWKNGGFDVSGTIPPGATYGTSVALPIPKPIVQLTAEIASGATGFDADTWEIEFPTPSAEVVEGRIVRISQITDSATTNFTDGSAANALGYFQILSVTAGPPDVVLLQRVPEANPDTGAVFFGNGPSAVAGAISIRVEVYDAISSLFSGSLDIGKLAAARLTNLIDPKTVGASVGFRDTNKPVPSSKPDRAIFDTRPGADPGNLLDLGFRAVYFPAKVEAGVAVPDFDHPIDSNEVKLDPAVNERQWIETDYASGVAYLSHTPEAGDPACEVAPGLGPFFASNNPRGEVVLFAACVPFSMEEGQTGAGVRVMASNPDSVTNGLGDNDFADVYGRRIITSPTVNTTIEPGVTTAIITSFTDLLAIPPSGFFFVGNVVAGALTTKNGPYFYQYTDLSGPNVRLNGITGPTGAVVVNPAAGGRIFFQRSLRSFDPQNASSDAVRGSSKRVNTLAFKNFGIEFSADGSVIIEAPAAAVAATLQSAYVAGNTIAVTAGEGSISFTNTADTTAVLAVGANSTGAAILTSVEDGVGFYTDVSGVSSSARGVEIEVSDNASDAIGVLVNHTGTGTGISVDQTGGGNAVSLNCASTGSGVVALVEEGVGFYAGVSGTTSTAAGVRVEITDVASASAGVRVTNDGNGPGLYVLTDGNGLGLYIRQSGTGNAIRVDDPGGVEVFGVTEAGRVTGEDYSFNTPTTFITRIDSSQMKAEDSADWTYKYNPVGGVGGPGWEKDTAAGTSLYASISIPRGATITTVFAQLNNPGAGMTVGMLTVNGTSGTPSTLILGSAATAGFGTQMFSAGLPVTVNTNNNYHIYFQSAIGNAVHWVDLFWTYDAVRLGNF